MRNIEIINEAIHTANKVARLSRTKRMVWLRSFIYAIIHNGDRGLLEQALEQTVPPNPKDSRSGR